MVVTTLIKRACPDNSLDTFDAYLTGNEILEKEKEIIVSMHQLMAHKRESLPQFKRS